jgi:hypothetical protein
VVISYVNVSRHSRLPRTLQAKGRPAPLRHVTKNPSPQLLLFPTLTNRDSRNSFRIRSYKKWRVSPVFSSQPLDLQKFRCAFCIPNGVAGRSEVRIPISPLAATLMDLPASVANKRLTVWLTPLDATLTKNRGGTPFKPRAYLFSSGLSSAPYLITSLLHYFVRSPRRGRMLGQRAKMEVVRPPRGVNSPRTTHHSG